MKNEKPFYASTTFWINMLPLVAMAIQYYLDTELIPVEYQAIALGIVNILNRLRAAGEVKKLTLG